MDADKRFALLILTIVGAVGLSHWHLSQQVSALEAPDAQVEAAPATQAIRWTVRPSPAMVGARTKGLWTRSSLESRFSRQAIR